MLFVIIAWITIHSGRNPRNGGSPPRDNSDVNIINFIRGGVFVRYYSLVDK